MLRYFNILLTLIALVCGVFSAVIDRPNNGDIYIVSHMELDDSAQYMDISTTEITPEEKNEINLAAVTQLCNATFSTPTTALQQFNQTGALPDEKDKTGLCYLRCFYEKSGLLDNWKLNKDLIRKYSWPATGDSLDVCENEGYHETNSCIRAYAIIKCLNLRALTDARNKPMV